MEDRRHHWIFAVLIATLILATSAPGARADTPTDGTTNVTVGTDPNQITVTADGSGSTPGSGGGGSAGSGDSSGTSCSLQPYYYVGVSPTGTDASGQTVTLLPEALICDGVFIGIVWVYPAGSSSGSGATPPTPPSVIALQLVERIPVPRGTIAVNPTRGLVGVESWFWIQGYDGSAIDHTTNAFGDVIEVRAWVSSYRWSFGDGSQATSSTPGEAYPKRSEVRHTYERSSDGHPAGYVVRVQYVFDVRYRVNGGAWLSLPGITRETTTAYPVRESQAVIGR